MLEEIGSADNAGPWLDNAIATKKTIMGFGHRASTVKEPHASVLPELDEAALSGLVGRIPNPSPCPSWRRGRIGNPSYARGGLMVPTSVSLLQKLRRPEHGEAWAEFVELYTPLMLAWARKLGLQDADATDLVQNVFVLLLRKMPEFVYDPSKSFRGWLRT